MQEIHVPPSDQRIGKNDRPKRIIGIKMMLFGKILVPMIIGILITAFITIFFVYQFNPIWITDSGAAFKSDYKIFTSELSTTASLVTNETLSKLAMNIDILGKHFLLLYHNQTAQFEISNVSDSHYFNAYDIFDGVSTPENWITENQTSNTSSMWSLPNQSIRTIFQLSSQSLINLKYSLNLDILASAQYDDSVEINAIYFGFENDGMFFSHPTLNYSALTAFKTADNTSCKTNAIDKAIDVRCLDWYYQTKLASQDALDRNYYDDLGVYEKRLNTFTTIYWNHNINILVLSLCTSLLDQNNEFIGVLCIEIQTIQLTNYLLSSSINSLPQYFYIVNPNKPEVIFHPTYMTCKTNCVYNDLIINLEFNNSDPSHNESITNFQNVWIPKMFNSLNTTTGIFERDGKDYYITIQKGYYRWEIGNNFVFTLVIVVDLEYLLERFYITEDNINSLIIYVTGIIIGIVASVIFVAMILIFIFSRNIVAPIDILVEHSNKIEKGNFDSDTLANYRVSNLELNTLFTIFRKLTGLLKFANVALKLENDASALINYAEALKLYQDLENKKGAGIIHNNIGNIHMKFDRFKEAISSYIKAIEICKIEITREQYHLEYVKEKILERQQINNQGIKIKPLDKALDPFTEKEINEIEMNLKKLQENLSKRVFQLANAYMNESVAYPDDQEKDNWDIVLRLMKEVIQIDQELHLFTSRRITSKIIISKVFFSIEHYYDAYNYIDEAEKDLEHYAATWENGDKLNENVDHFLNEYQRIKDTPPIILKQEIMLQQYPIQNFVHHDFIKLKRGILLKKNGKAREAAIILTQCLETGKIYHPVLRNKCLEHLKDILEKKNLLHKAPNIQKILDRNLKKNNNDIIFLLDNSESMKGNKEEYALREILVFFDKYMEPKDRVGFIRFNHNCHVIFTLRERGKNHVYLRKSIQNSKETYECEGETAFFSGLYEALELYKKADNKDNLKWIIALTDGCDNSSKITYDEIYEKLKKSDVNLIIIGLGLSEEIIPELIRLCRATKDGVFLESADDSKNIEVAFQAMKKQIWEAFNQTFNESLL